MKNFPFSRLRPITGWITAALHYNPYGNCPPSVTHTITINIEPLNLGSDAAMPEYETVVDSSIILSGLQIDGQSWNALTGTYTFDEDQDGSFCVSSAHNPVTVQELILEYRDGTTYDVDLTATFHFEDEGSGYEDKTTRLVFSVVHRGYVFCVPQWGNPDEVSFPAEWRIPSVEHNWSPAAIREFAGRYYDLSQFAVITIEDGILHATPIGA